MIDQISNFVEKIRLETASASPAGSVKVRKVRNEGLAEEEPLASTSQVGDVAIQEEEPARKIANLLKVQADQYKAVAKKPTGMAPSNISVVNRDTSLGVALQPQSLTNEDDEFFHLTCHVDPGLRAKIEKGDYVELEKLLPKGKNFSQRYTEDNKMQLVNRDGASYWIPVEREKINSLKRWDQSFRIYAAIYSKANPLRAHEIWQYVHCINTAASTCV